MQNPLCTCYPHLPKKVGLKRCSRKASIVGESLWIKIRTQVTLIWEPQSNSHLPDSPTTHHPGCPILGVRISTARQNPNFRRLRTTVSWWKKKDGEVSKEGEILPESSKNQSLALTISLPNPPNEDWLDAPWCKAFGPPGKWGLLNYANTCKWAYRLDYLQLQVSVWSVHGAEPLHFFFHCPQIWFQSTKFCWATTTNRCIEVTLVWSLWSRGL